MMNLRKLLTVKPTEVDAAPDDHEDVVENDLIEDELLQRAEELKKQERLALFQVSIGGRIEPREIVRLKELFQTRNMRRPTTC